MKAGMLSRLAFTAVLPAVLTVTLPSLADAQAPGYGPPPPPPQQIQQRQPAAPKISVGLGVGHYWQEDERDGGETSLLARLALSPTFFIGAELSHVAFDDGYEGGRIGAELGVRFRGSRLANTYMTLGAGSLDSEVDFDRNYVEAGLGLEVPLGRHIALVGEARLASNESALADDQREISARWRGLLMVRF
jgi:hypothetical protein